MRVLSRWVGQRTSVSSQNDRGLCNREVRGGECEREYFAVAETWIFRVRLRSIYADEDEAGVILDVNSPSPCSRRDAHVDARWTQEGQGEERIRRARGIDAMRPDLIKRPSVSAALYRLAPKCTLVLIPPRTLG